jgi:putative adenylate-forming enzyme
MHLNEEFIWFEKEWVDDTSGRFVPIVTDFSRTTQPIVRYHLDDILVLDRRRCACGSATTVISRIEGRLDDLLYGQKSGGTLAPLFPDHLRHVVIQATDKLKDYNLIQETPTSLFLAVDPAFPDEDWQRIANAIRDVFHVSGCAIPAITRTIIAVIPLTTKKRRITRRFSVTKDS